jgi:hypothetical protein
MHTLAGVHNGGDNMSTLAGVHNRGDNNMGTLAGVHNGGDNNMSTLAGVHNAGDNMSTLAGVHDRGLRGLSADSTGGGQLAGIVALQTSSFAVDHDPHWNRMTTTMRQGGRKETENRTGQTILIRLPF